MALLLKINQADQLPIPAAGNTAEPTGRVLNAWEW